MASHTERAQAASLVQEPHPATLSCCCRFPHWSWPQSQAWQVPALGVPWAAWMAYGVHAARTWARVRLEGLWAEVCLGPERQLGLGDGMGQSLEPETWDHQPAALCPWKVTLPPPGPHLPHLQRGPSCTGLCSGQSTGSRHQAGRAGIVAHSGDSGKPPMPPPAGPGPPSSRCPPFYLPLGHTPHHHLPSNPQAYPNQAIPPLELTSEHPSATSSLPNYAFISANACISLLKSIACRAES